jgi:CDP-diacylglycerol--serine O-phosphatidyltransferase
MDLKFFVPQAVTASRIVFGAAAAFAAIFHRAELAAALITLGAVTDGLDGPIARKLGVTSEFGALFDYFADYLCYVVAPSILSLDLMQEPVDVVTLGILALPLLAGAIRYARNAIWLRSENFAEVGFPGLGTVIYAFFIVTLTYVHFEEIIGVGFLSRLILFIVLMLSCMMVLPLRFPKLMKHTWFSAPVLIGFTIMPFFFPRILSAIALAGGCLYTFISPFFISQRRRSAHPQNAGDAARNHRRR